MYVKRDDGYWEWALKIGRQYRGYHVSGRNLIAIAYNESTQVDEVYYLDVEACEPSPTQMPSTSQGPSTSTYPSPMPSITTTYGYTPSGGGLWKTMIPTEGNYRCVDPWLAEMTVTPESSFASPTETCQRIDITIAFDDDPSMSWDVQMVDNSGGTELLMLSKGAPDEAYQLRSESLCVEAGVYRFTIYGEKGIRHPGFYDVRSHDGQYIARGGEFDCSETVTFSIPLTSAPTAMPSSEASVTVTTYGPTVPSLTPAPTALAGPTGTCTLVDITVVHDMFPCETQFDIQKINSDGDGGEVLHFFDPIYFGEEEGMVRMESICLVSTPLCSTPLFFASSFLLVRSLMLRLSQLLIS
jgi:hypothetical protein